MRIRSWTGANRREGRLGVNFFVYVFFSSGVPKPPRPPHSHHQPGSLDPSRYIQYRLYRDSTRYVHGSHVRDVGALNRDPARVLFVTADPDAAAGASANALLVRPWAGEDAADTGLLDLLPFLEAVFRADVPDARDVAATYKGVEVGPAFRERMKAAAAEKAAKAGGAPARRGLFARG